MSAMGNNLDAILAWDIQRVTASQPHDVPKESAWVVTYAAAVMASTFDLPLDEQLTTALNTIQGASNELDLVTRVVTSNAKSYMSKLPVDSRKEVEQEERQSMFLVKQRLGLMATYMRKKHDAEPPAAKAAAKRFDQCVAEHTTRSTVSVEAPNEDEVNALKARVDKYLNAPDANKDLALVLISCLDESPDVSILNAVQRQLKLLVDNLERYASQAQERERAAAQHTEADDEAAATADDEAAATADDEAAATADDEAAATADDEAAAAALDATKLAQDADNNAQNARAAIHAVRYQVADPKQVERLHRAIAVAEAAATAAMMAGEAALPQIAKNAATVAEFACTAAQRAAVQAAAAPRMRPDDPIAADRCRDAANRQSIARSDLTQGNLAPRFTRHFDRDHVRDADFAAIGYYYPGPFLEPELEDNSPIERLIPGTTGDLSFYWTFLSTDPVFEAGFANREPQAPGHEYPLMRVGVPHHLQWRVVDTPAGTDVLLLAGTTNDLVFVGVHWFELVERE